ncbi:MULTISPECIES: YgfZ/GcvT domain-containing protein [unclassified Haematospirillum]|uniref:CAF17-like 4Fe-4S cluster assembly/insertion protein YgfZ n=1 Tax=unclassified Haematospirillum TaxID=2622088 RepID=UPI00143BB15C|nr:MULTISPECIES: folate-binding protein YgfZ [unclassified Haematospirillum]NKD55500.1 folate-binding protein YgfZ [Haematospirillum sp. H4890]NKD75640.1 folate-binding protein YgfZ [Haematospirillum sp. H4485]NKD86751.1 folate-binding protein YgfZ [Haematospirillum sp. 15-248]
MSPETAPFHELAHRGALILSGDDHRAFLQGLVSADIRTVTENHSAWTALLTPQGKFLHDFFIYQLGNTLLLEGERERLEDLRTRLLRYRLRAKVILESAPDLAVFGTLPPFHGPLKNLSHAGDTITFGDGIACMDPRLPAGGIRIVASRQAISETGLTTTDMTEAAWEQNRIRNGLPDGSRDIEPEKGFLLEYGFDELGGVDFRKGCYVGQETTARMKWKHLTKKRLVPLRGEGKTIPQSNSPITLPDGQVVGAIRSSTTDETGTGFLAMGIVRLDAIQADDLRCDTMRLKPCPPAWLRLPDNR